MLNTGPTVTPEKNHINQITSDSFSGPFSTNMALTHPHLRHGVGATAVLRQIGASIDHPLSAGQLGATLTDDGDHLLEEMPI